MSHFSQSGRRSFISHWPWWLRWPARLALAGAVLGLAAWCVVWFIYASLARGFDLEKLGSMPERSIVYDVHGQEIGRLHGANRVTVPLGEVSPHFVSALLAREDDRFYRHGGIDYRGLARALLRDLKDRSFTQGASTLTMQLARNSYALSGKSLHRKLLEMALARRIEAAYSKDQILELYMNRIFFGSGIYGVERAAQAYFGRPARDLDLGESAMLAAIIRGPNKFSPFRVPEVAHSGRDMVLDRMALKDRISPAEAEAAKARPTAIQKEPAVSGQESYALDSVRRALDRVLDAEDEEDGGLRIYTTIDLTLQAAAEKALEEKLAAVEKTRGYPHPTRAQWRQRAQAGTAQGAPDYVQGSVVVLDNTTGAALAVVGGRDFSESAFNRAMSARRPIGSTFKPFVYTAGVQSGLFPTTLVDDGPIDIGGWRPRNSDNTFGGLLPMETGLARSRNTMTVRVGEYAGLDRVVELAERLGLGKVARPSPQLSIGNHDATLFELAGAYTCFPNAGERLRPFLLGHVENKEGDVIFRNERLGYPAMAAGASWCVSRMLEKVFAPGGTAASARTLGYKGPAAGKTGTTDDFKDAWFVGYHQRLTCGVWIGLDQPGRITGQGYGSRMALPVWVGIIKEAEKLGYTPGPPTPELMTEKIELCAASGLLATTGCRAAGAAVTTELPIDLIDRFATEPCGQHGRGGISSRREPREERSPSSTGRSFWNRLKSIFR